MEEKNKKYVFYKETDIHSKEIRNRVRSVSKDKYGHEKGIYGKKGQLLIK